MIYLQLFLSFLQVGAFSFGGGYAAIPLIRQQVITGHGWLTMEEFTDLITISQMTPGPIAINSATFVGLKIAGLGGAAAATAGCILPSCILVTLLAWIYLKYRKLSLLQGILKSLRPAVVAMIAASGLSILISALWNGSAAQPASFRPGSAVIFLIALILLRVRKLDAVLVMIISGAMEILFFLFLNIL